jgi:hypothetical protein
MSCKTLKMSAIAAAIAVALGAPAMAGMSKPDYQASKKDIESAYEAAKASCGTLAANAKDICVAEAKGTEKIARAELEVAYQPTVKTRYDARIARAEAEYSVATEKCDDRAGNAKDVCVKEAKVAQTTAKADAKARMKTVEANKAAGKEIAEARKDAASDKRDASYALAKERCQALAGGQKDACMAEAKALFGGKS